MRTRTVHLPPAAMEALKQQLEAFREKFGREPGAGDPIFFDPDATEPRPSRQLALAAEWEDLPLAEERRLHLSDEARLKDGTVVPLSEVIKQHRQGFIDKFGCVPPAWCILLLMREAGLSPEKIEGYRPWAELVADTEQRTERRTEQRRPRRRRQARRKH
jgi:hypothetical protein